MNAFNNEKYLKIQHEKILERLQQFGDKIYIEFGGKLFYDAHAERVLPGYVPTNKIDLLTEMRDDIEVIIAIYAGDIVNMKNISGTDESYPNNVIRTVNELRERGIKCNNVVITRIDQFDIFAMELGLFDLLCKSNDINIHCHTYTEGYPHDIQTVVSQNGYGKNSYIQTEERIVIVTGPGANSGKLATCMSQLYHEHNLGLQSGYAKFESFPIWNLDINHPVNVAYEAATADIGDYNVIDSYYLESEGKEAVNYNRDMETFPILQKIMGMIYGYDVYKSPTHMGVNMLGSCIEDDDKVQLAAIEEIYRRIGEHEECDYEVRLSDKLIKFNSTYR